MRLVLAALGFLFAAFPAQAQMKNAVVVAACGVVTPPKTVGPLTNLTMDRQGRLCMKGITTGCAQATAYLARTVGGNEGAPANIPNITNLICGLVTDGVWSNLDVLYVFAQANVTDAQLNLIGATYNATVVTAGTFTAFRGLTGFAYDTGFNPSTAPSPHYTQNLANYGVWSSGVPEEAPSQMGNAALSSLYTWFTDGNFVARINNSSTSGQPSPAAEGLYGGDRANVNNLDPYFNGVYKINKSGVTSAPANATFLVGKTQGGAVTGQTIREAHIGGSLGAAGNLALYTRLRTYLTAVGSP